MVYLLSIFNIGLEHSSSLVWILEVLPRKQLIPYLCRKRKAKILLLSMTSDSWNPPPKPMGRDARGENFEREMELHLSVFFYPLPLHFQPYYQELKIFLSLNKLALVIPIIFPVLDLRQGKVTNSAYILLTRGKVCKPSPRGALWQLSVPSARLEGSSQACECKVLYQESCSWQSPLLSGAGNKDRLLTADPIGTFQTSPWLQVKM